jgi:hypothetical protein
VERNTLYVGQRVRRFYHLYEMSNKITFPANSEELKKRTFGFLFLCLTETTMSCASKFLTKTHQCCIIRLTVTECPVIVQVQDVFAVRAGTLIYRGADRNWRGLLLQTSVSTTDGGQRLIASAKARFVH